MRKKFTEEEFLKLEIYNYLFKEKNHEELTFEEIYKKFKNKMSKHKLKSIIDEYIELGDIIINNGMLIIIGY